MTDSHDRTMLRAAAAIACRAHGAAEPNPTVGCIIEDAEGHRVGEGRTSRFGGPHAEVMALAAAGTSARGGTAWVTLEPCNHHGRTPPCVDAVIRAGLARVVIGMVDPNPIATGGIDRLREAGIRVDIVEDLEEVRRLHDPFRHRLATGRPWVVAKWAETIDGDLIAPAGTSRIISGPRSHALVHRERGRVDAILTGIGTVLADDPRLDPRCSRPRRIPHRVVVDPALQLPVGSRILGEGEGRVILATSESAAERHPERLEALRGRGAEPIVIEMDTMLEPRASFERIPAACWHALLEILSDDFAVGTVMTEAGPGLLRSLFRHRLVDAALVFTAPRRFDPSTGTEPRPRDLLEGGDLEMIWNGLRGEDRVAWWHRRA